MNRKLIILKPKQSKTTKDKLVLCPTQALLLTFGVQSKQHSFLSELLIPLLDIA